MELHRITVYIETDDRQRLDALCDAFTAAICPDLAGEPHSCPDRWMLIESAVPNDELAELGDLDSFLNE